MNMIINHEVEVQHDGCKMWMPYNNFGNDIEAACDCANALVAEGVYSKVRVVNTNLGYSWL